MTRYKKTCNRGCGQEIELTDETGNGWLPFNLDGSAHVCQTKQNGKVDRRSFDEVAKTIPTPTKEQVKEVTKDYLDHTLAQGQKEKLKLKIFTDPTAEGLSLAYNNFGENHKIQFSQYHPVNALYTIAVYFEEIKQ